MSDRIQKFWDALAEWSQATFGSDIERGPVGPLKHLAKEVQECLSDPYDLVEKADCLFLIFDAVRRSGCTLDQLMDAAEAKLLVNRKRRWGKPRQDGEPIEHIRSTETKEK